MSFNILVLNFTLFGFFSHFLGDIEKDLNKRIASKRKEILASLQHPTMLDTLVMGLAKKSYEVPLKVTPITPVVKGGTSATPTGNGNWMVIGSTPTPTSPSTSLTSESSEQDLLSEAVMNAEIIGSVNGSNGLNEDLPSSIVSGDLLEMAMKSTGLGDFFY